MIGTTFNNFLDLYYVGYSKQVSHDDDPEMEANQNDNSDDKQYEYPMKLQNSELLANFDGKLGHLLEKCSENESKRGKIFFLMSQVGPMLLIMMLMWVTMKQLNGTLAE